MSGAKRLEPVIQVFRENVEMNDRKQPNSGTCQLLPGLRLAMNLAEVGLR